MGLFDGVLGQINGLIGGLGGGASQGKQSRFTQMPYRMNLGITDGDAAYDTMAEVLAIIGALAAGSVWTKVWEKTVPAQQGIRWGFGSPAFPHNQGYMWFCSLDTAINFQEGVVRLRQANSREIINYTVIEQEDSRLHLPTVTTLTTATPTSINDMVALPEKVEFPIVGEDSKLQIWYRCITVATAEDNVGFSIPVTVYQ